MKRKFISFIILAILLFGVAGSGFGSLFLLAGATYVEGIISRDTVWTVVDSPFVLSKDVTVQTNVTLTIEPGVQVRFGGSFSLIVAGKLYANGTESAITFTSNKENPLAGDWDSIRFIGVERSVLVGCAVAYASDGVFIQNGDVDIDKTNITFCSKSGITVIGGRSTVTTSSISFCSISGINVTNSLVEISDSSLMNNGKGIILTGDQAVTVRRNQIIGNGHGIHLMGVQASSVTISENTISANSNNGIFVESDSHPNLSLILNEISSNQVGLYVSSQESTQFSNNSVAFCGTGIFYSRGLHSAHFNDIYGNQIGMNVEVGATADASHNYWGHESGPYHESLNPQGKGNQVGGSGEDLDFIFFMATSFEEINTRPAAVLLSDKITVRQNEIVRFFATNSLDDHRVDMFTFDFGDGNATGWTTLSASTHKYFSLGTYTASLIVMDDCGATSLNPANILVSVENLPSLYAETDVSSRVVHEGEQVTVSVHVTDLTSDVENAEVRLVSLRGGSFSEPNGYTDQSGQFTTTLTAPDTTFVTNLGIVTTVLKSSYADGSDVDYLEISPTLSVQVVPESHSIRTEDTTKIDIYVGSNDVAVVGAFVSIDSDVGYLSARNGITDASGLVSILFTAPETTIVQDATVTATATMDGYVSGQGQAVIAVEPKVLSLTITVSPGAISSEESVNITVQVEYEMVPVQGATVNMTSDYLSATGLTDAFGNFAVLLEAPKVQAPLNFTMTATALKDKYAVGQSQTQILVEPAEFDVGITTESMVYSGRTIVVTVRVTREGNSVSNASVEMSAQYGSFPNSTGLTNTDGACQFTYEAPRTTFELTETIVVNATKQGYLTKANQTEVTVTAEMPQGTDGGWPLTTILLILIPIVAAVIIVVLVKTKVIQFSSEEE